MRHTNDHLFLSVYVLHLPSLKLLCGSFDVNSLCSPLNTVPEKNGTIFGGEGEEWECTKVLPCLGPCRWPCLLYLSL